jgi:ABC-2 type transport system permease protein
MKHLLRMSYLVAGLGGVGGGRADYLAYVVPGILMIAILAKAPGDAELGTRILLFVVAATAVVAIVVGYALSMSLTEPLRDQLRTLLCQTTDGLFEGRRPSHG